jgi:hypothetical protein
MESHGQNVLNCDWFTVEACWLKRPAQYRSCESATRDGAGTVEKKDAIYIPRIGNEYSEHNTWIISYV